MLPLGPIPLILCPAHICPFEISAPIWTIWLLWPLSSIGQALKVKQVTVASINFLYLPDGNDICKKKHSLHWAMLIFASGLLIIARWLIAQFHLGRKFVQWTCKVQHNMQLLRGHGFQQTCIYFALKHRPKLTKQTPLVSARWPRPILDTVTAIFTLLVLFSSHQMSSLLILTRLTINTSLC